MYSLISMEFIKFVSTYSFNESKAFIFVENKLQIYVLTEEKLKRNFYVFYDVRTQSLLIPNHSWSFYKRHDLDC